MPFFRANLIGLKADRDKKEIGTKFRSLLRALGSTVYRGFVRKADPVLGHNIIVVPKRY